VGSAEEPVPELNASRVDSAEEVLLHLVEIFLPLYDSQGAVFSRGTFDRVQADMTRRFGGVTAFLRAPAEGFWKDAQGAIERDDVVIIEVMTEHLDREWWASYRRAIEQELGQAEIVIRASVIDRL
jgi:hypothetical protein